MNTKNIFYKKIKPELGRITKEKKYLEILLEVGKEQKSIRASEISKHLQPANHTLNRLSEKGFLEVTEPAGDGLILIDPINNVQKLFDKRAMIEEYFSNLRSHLQKDQGAKNVAKKELGINSDWQMDLWLEEAEDKSFEEYNKVVFELLAKGFGVKGNFYGPLTWKKMAKKYGWSEKTKRLMQ